MIRHARALVTGLEQVDVLVTDKDFSAEERAQLDKFSLEVVTV